jgi:hypothetical protein
MNTAMKRGLVVALTVLGLGVMTQEARAGTADQIIVSVTPGNPTYAVGITSPEVGGYDFASVNLGATTISTLAIVVKSSGTISEYFALSVTADGGWTPVVLDSAAPTFNKFEMQGHFGATQPADGTFAAVNDLMTTAIPGTGSGLYNQGSQTIPGASQNLWLRLKMPSSTSLSGQRLMTVTVNGQAT